MSLLRNVSTVLRGTIVAQAIGFLALPLMARLFPVAAFGQFQLFQSIVSVGLVVVALRYEIAILAARSESELRAVVQLSLLMGIAMSILIGVVICLLGLIQWPGSITNWSFGGGIVALALLVGGASQTASYIVTRQGAYSTGANVKIVQALGFAGVGTGLGIARPIVSGVIWADIANKTLGAAVLLFHAFRTGVFTFRRLSWRRMFVIAIKYRNYPFLSLPGGVCNALTIAITPFMVFATFGQEVTGQLGLLERGVTLPINLIALAVTQVFTSEITKAVRENQPDLRQKFHQIVKTLSLIAVFPLVLMMIFGPTAFELIFGPQWKFAGELCRILAPFYFFSFVSGPTGLVLLALQKQTSQFHWEWLRLAVLILVWTVARRCNFSALAAISLSFGVQLVFIVIFLILVDRTIAMYDRKRQS